MKPSWKCLLIGVVAAVVLTAAIPQADAQCWLYGPTAWGHSYSPYYCGYSSCYTTASCYTPSCYDSCGWYLGWRRGPVRRLLLGRYRWYWNGGWSCCSPCNVCGVTDGCGCTGDAVAPSAPTPAPTPAKKPVADPAMPSEPPTPAPPAPAEPSAGATSAAESGFLTIWVPYDAKVTVNGLETKSTGSKRQFVSFGLKPGFSYKYVVKAEVLRDGQMEEDTRTVMLTAGKISAVAFGFNVPSHQMASVP